ncbi:MAG: NAD-dependent malic enzyme [Gammaproteobacteria bacterium]|nr:NAD-dependent malic enzyme [Gammaproteobacteria bacterium]
MLSYRPIFDEYGELQFIETPLTGHDLLYAPKLNKEFAFSSEERHKFNLLGKLPYNVENIEEQADRIYKQYSEAGSNLNKNIFLNDLHDKNETLFYFVVQNHLKEMLPIIYTPTMSEVVEKLSLQFRRTRGLYLSFPEREAISNILDNRLNPEIDLIIMTDGERILGIGDQGACGMMIPIAKLMVYSVCGGVNPYRMLPIQIDVGTNNQRLLNDPLYYGWRHPRICGKEYDDFIQLIVTTIQKKFPTALLHWEDFGRENARRNLEMYREQLCTFNDDMQGTGAVTLAAILAAIKIARSHLNDQRIVIFGAGTAGVGIADQLYDAMIREGLEPQKANTKFWLVDKQGLLTADIPDLLPFQKKYARDKQETTGWQPNTKGKLGLYETVKYVKPTILIGASTQAGAFTQEIVELMAGMTDRPIIFPLSNPTEKAEAIPINLLNWTHGKALIATGSPFEDVHYHGKTFPVAQCNNSYIFPGIGLGVTVTKARRLTDDMIWMAAKTLSECSPAITTGEGSILPDLNDIRNISQHIALAVAEQARKEGLAQISDEIDLKKLIEKSAWQPKYVPYRKID